MIEIGHNLQHVIEFGMLLSSWLHPETIKIVDE